MRMGPRSVRPRGAGALAALACLLAALLAPPAGAAASARLHPAPASQGEAARVARYWTPARMRATPPLDAPRGASLAALVSFTQIAEPTVAPNAVNGRLFIRQGKSRGFCSATAIDTPSRTLVLTAGHCINSGPEPPNGHSVWSSFLEFVPAYSGGAAPFGAFIAHRKSVFALKQWVEFGNPNFDVGAIVTAPNAEGVNVADAVGGGAAIATDLSRKQDFQTFGYPGETRWMQGCDSPYVGDDVLTYSIPGPPTIAIRCHWIPGASGGGWLIDEGTTIDGLTSYGKRTDRHHTFSPYFSSRNVGRLTAGL
jgi:V8-like Glu-specific endopeptidase